MNKHPFYALLFAAACSIAVPATAQKVKAKKAAKTAASTAAPAADTDLSVTYANTITQEDLRKHLSILASDAYEGRETGEKGQKMAAEYIAKYFQDLGLTGPVQGSDNPYVQHFQLERTHWGDVSFTVGKQSFKWLEDFFIFGKSPFQEETTLQPVFVGYGIEQEGYSDYAGKDVKGKDVVMLGGEPKTKEGKFVLGTDGKPSKWSTDRSAKMTTAMQKGARSVITINPDAALFMANINRIKPYLQQSQMGLPKATTEDAAKPASYAIFSVSPALGASLVGTTPAALQQYQADVLQAGKPVAVKWKASPAKLKAPIIKENVTTENVMGYLEGTDKKDELLVCSAHYDHIGITDGKVNNGADDDGSGTVSVLELAQAFAQAKKDGHGPRRSILFITVTGEEKGLLGSEYYTEHPVFPLASTIADLNIDMIGRIDYNHKKGDNYVGLVGSDKLSSELHAINEANNTKYTKLDLDYRYNVPNEPERIYYRSDHYNFAKNGIPVIFYTTGEHEDYHKETDEVDKIEFPLMETRARLVFHTAWELTNRDNRIVVDSNKP
ncbi:M28 family peptidase [Hymenobacter sp. GOD-10R]|uniref:M28 family peptidase n=1 Tax=Hymenobacter sp. GOD-10R TaxID=3093922 RepID=UPI002D792AC3|nr:M28 family peptidase [Hymenobacter sp. GOD-10R]WRQ27901.1 M28 family peptidase [Hymenobacter sp. GOD-10R]